MSQMLKSSGAVGLATLLSRVLGMAREMAYAHFMGTQLIASAFTYAFTIPNLFRRLLGEGALTAAFIPHFKEKEKKEGEKEMWRSANAVICGLTIVTTLVVGIMMLGATALIATGWFKVKTVLMLDLLRMMCPYLLLVCLAAVFMSMLNSRGHFFVPALGSCLLNVVMIASVYWIAPWMGDTPERRVFGLAIGVVLAGFAQAAYQLPWLFRDGFRLEWVAPWSHPSVRQVAARMVPGIVGVAAFQLNVMVSQGIGFWVADHIVSSFGFAVRLMELPQGLFGVSMAIYLLPTLSGLASDKKYPEFRSSLQQGLGYVLVSNVYAAGMLVVLGEPIVRLLFERGSFEALDTQRVTHALVFLAPGLIAYSSVNILARAFYALGDTGTPTRISIACLIFNLVLTALFVYPLQEGGMGLANTVTSLFNTSLLLFALRKKLGRLDFGPLRRAVLSLIPCGALAMGVAWGGSRLCLSWWGTEGLPARAAQVFLPALIALAAYFGLARLLGVRPAMEVASTALSGIRRRLA